MHRLSPIVHRAAYTRAVEVELNAYFDEVLIAPLQNILTEHRLESTRENGPMDTVTAALKQGRLWYAAGVFFGKLNATISSALRAIGATMNKDGNFALAADKLPHWIRGAVEQALDRARKLHAQITETLATIAANVAIATKTGLETAKAIPAIIKNLDEQFTDTVLAIDVVEVTAELTPAVAQALRADFTDNLNLSIKNFLDEEIPRLREIVQKNAFAGYRADTLAQIIETRFGVTKRKAAFLADQETSLLTSKFREQRYKAIGIRDYVWSTSHDERVREDHRHLDGKRFSFDSPPITNRTTGARNNPGEDFRCRCVPIPVIEAPE